MERKFKHKKTGEIISYKDGVIKSGSFVFELGCEPSKEYWEEIKKELPIGTKITQVRNIESIKETSYEKTKEGWYFGDLKVWIDESDIGEGKRFQIVEEKSVLFTTEDGVSIKEGDNYWFIWVKGKHLPNYQTLYHPYFVENAAKLDSDEYWSKNAKFFSTKKAAENYIVCNKPCLSFNDVWNIGDNKSSDNNYIIISKKQLKELVKAKIDL